MLDEELGSSELGTLEYWEERYESEIINFSRHGDPGEVWFGEDIVRRIVNWISTNIDKNLSIADVGCGNGHILIELAHLGYGHLVGFDYSEKAISLAKAVAERQELPIEYIVKDILNGLGDTFDVMHDKGTYDAISLSEKSKQSREKYISAVSSALKDSGYFIITSCNWTESELEDQYKEYFSLYKIIPTPRFKFGGKVGNIVSICVFKKKQLSKEFAGKHFFQKIEQTSQDFSLKQAVVNMIGQNEDCRCCNVWNDGDWFLQRGQIYYSPHS